MFFVRQMARRSLGCFLMVASVAGPAIPRISLASSNAPEPPATTPASRDDVRIFTIPTFDSAPLDIAPGPDGNLWFTEENANQVARITPEGVVSEYLMPFGVTEPQGLTAGPDGSVWFTAQGDNEGIGRVDASSGSVSFFPLPYNDRPFPQRERFSLPNGITTGPDGNLWWTEDGFPGDWIGRSTSAGSITNDWAFGALPTNSQPTAIVAGPDGNLWFTQYLGDRIGRISPSGNVTHFEVDPETGGVCDRCPTDIAVGADSKLWFTESSHPDEDRGSLGYITAAGDITHVPVRERFRPQSLALGSDGNIWVRGQLSDELARATPDGTIEYFDLPYDGGSHLGGPSIYQFPEGITSGPDGALWMTDYDGNRIIRVDVVGLNGCKASDSDGDGLPDAVETARSGTDPAEKDTDGDGLWDSWEVSPNVPCGGFNLDGDPEIEARRGEVFGPYRQPNGQRRFTGPDERITPQYAEFVRPPDPLHKDVYLELDWQDCHAGGCPELGWDKSPVTLIDPMHHAPSLRGIALAIAALEDAPAQNPDATAGVNLHVLVDERIRHEPNCDVDRSYARGKFLGTPRQRRGPALVRAARFVVYRHVWSGHSTADDSHEDGGGFACKKPSDPSFTKMSLGAKPLPSYDYSPFGDAQVGGNSILVSLGPAWICPSWVTQLNPLRTPLNPKKWFQDGVCFRDLLTRSLGMFPARFALDGEMHRVPRPMHAQLAVAADPEFGREEEEKGIAQLWGRSLVHLLGHSLGIVNDADVGNDPLANPAMHGAFPVLPTPYETEWEDLRYAPPSKQNPAVVEAFSPSEECRPLFTEAHGVQYRPARFETSVCP